ncbi:MAG: hypothetical protein LBP20_04325 [Treponema sp.]|jgi:hypothetical protein|nr:hypothetical protein [Treponema sp.]
MRKKLLLLGVAGFLAVNVFADHSGDRLGLGLFAGAGSATAAGGAQFNGGISLKVPGLPVFWGINASIGNNATAVSVTGDYYIFDDDLVRDNSFDLDWFLGLGGFGHFYFGDPFSAALGVRVPIGLSWHVNQNFELFADITPGLGVKLTGSPLYWVGGGELGLRVWF